MGTEPNLQKKRRGQPSTKSASTRKNVYLPYSKENNHPKGRCTRQMHYERGVREERKRRENVEEKYQKEISNLNRNITISIQSRIKDSYGFLANPRYSPSLNTSMLLRNMLAWIYFNCPSNLEMQDLTTKGTYISHSLTTIIGLGLKLIPTLRRPKCKLASSFAQFKK